MLRFPALSLTQETKNRVVMKKLGFIITVVLLISHISSFQPAAAQEKTKEEKEKEMKDAGGDHSAEKSS